MQLQEIARTNLHQFCVHWPRGVDFMAELSQQKIEFRTDGAQPMTSLQEKVQLERTKSGLTTLLSNGHVRDSQSMGSVEAAIQWWRNKLKAIRFCTEARYGIVLDPAHPLWPHLCL